MRAVDLLDELVSAEHAEHAGDLCAEGAALARVVGQIGEQERQQVLVAEAVGQELAAGDGLEQAGVGLGPRTQAADVAAAEFSAFVSAR